MITYQNLLRFMTKKEHFQEVKGHLKKKQVTFATQLVTLCFLVAMQVVHFSSLRPTNLVFRILKVYCLHLPTEEDPVGYESNKDA